MTTRREIIKAGAGLAAIIAAGKAPAALIRSMLAARNGLMAGGGWKNPYVTDGLIAMWDGEWNAGPGKHEDNPDEWIDIVGGEKASKAGSGHSFDANSFVGNGSCGWVFTPPDSIFDAIYDVSVPITLEVCVEYDDTIQTELTPYRHNFVVIGRHTGNNLLWSPSFLWSYKRFCGLKICVPAYETSNGGNTFFHGTLTSTRSEVYKNAISISANSSTVFTSAYKEGCFAMGYGFGGGLGWHTFYVVCRLHSIRFYNRVMTAAEIAANYAVDKARFGLPDAT